MWNKLRSFVISLCYGVFLSISFTACSLTTPQKAVVLDESQIFNLGTHQFPISTQVPAAQEAFNRGLTLAYGFSHLAAEKEFRRAAELDPQAAMPWWGVALVNGPHINYPLVPADKAATAWEALEKAQAASKNSSPLEQKLIQALSARYVAKQPQDRSHLDKNYAFSMKRVFKAYPTNADVATLFAESLMDLHPWNLFDHRGKAKPWTAEITTVLEKALQLNRQHPGANHLYIHLVEASDSPQRGVPSADILRTLVPGSGHLVHMPGHIYIRVGRWDDAAQANLSAISADHYYSKLHPRPGFYGIYMSHNHHFLSFVRMMQGQKKAALNTAQEMIAGMPADFLKEYGPIADGFMAVIEEILMRFGDWEQILSRPEPAKTYPFARAMWRFTRASAYNALGRESEAKQERKAFEAAVKRVPKEATFGNNMAHNLLKIARLVIHGEADAKKGNYKAAIKSLRSAVELEDSLTYDEPPDWIIPVRHALGLVLLRAQQAAEAEKIYREDLKKFPKNGWSLYGLSRSLSLQGRDEEASQVMTEFKAAWSSADTPIEGSCMCLKGV